jgi:hypothetical protein
MTPRHKHGWDVQGFALWLTVVMVLLSLIVAQAVWPAERSSEWPEGWSPEGKVIRSSMGGRIPTTDGGSAQIVVTKWSDGTEVYFVRSTDRAWRAVMVDPTPDERCGQVWIDTGMTGERAMVRRHDTWTAPAWLWTGPFVEGCELKEQGTGA